MEALLRPSRIFIYLCLLFICVICEYNPEINDIIPITNSVSANFVDKCGAGEACVRFCCDNSSLCSNIEYFNKSSMAEAENLDENFKILKGIPSCHETSGIHEQETSWNFLKVSDFHYWFRV